ncbi:hypothetical protein F2Q69_00005630 [Brassica cretica]|uniref:Uncharacterized protein n=1 Tax=Brassica cretica TaxID=69181 RepID=A0A8S9P7J9_BRACR|nr:hypothetical protein F2Q69_00005630 [Brassica cretica]
MDAPPSLRAPRVLGINDRADNPPPAYFTFYRLTSLLVSANGGSWSRYLFYVLEDNTSCEEGNLPFLRATWGRLDNPKSDFCKILFDTGMWTGLSEERVEEAIALRAP